jgi:predicted permease
MSGRDPEEARRETAHGGPPAPPALARAWFALMQRAFPARVRSGLGDAMVETFADRWVERRWHGRLALARFLLGSSADMVRSGLSERLRGRRPAPLPSARRGSLMQTFGSDVRFALRGLRRSPSFAAVAVLTLALGIGATTTIFTVLEAILLRPWPFRDASALVVPVTTHPSTGDRWSVNYADYEDWRAAGVFESVAVYQRASADMAAPGGEPERVGGVRTSDGFLEVFGLSAALGRLPAADEYAAAADPVVVLTDGFWRSRFAADPAVLGRTIRLNGVAYTVIGVLPREADALATSLVTPLRPDAQTLEIYRDRDNFAFSSIARLAPGRDFEATRAQLATVASRIEREHSALREGTSADIVALSRWVAGDELSTVLWVALGAVGLVLLIGCANLANLLLARGVRRERELAVRGALGAGRTRLVFQLLVESTVLALLGGAAGVLLASVAVRALVANAPDGVSRLDAVGLNLPVLAFALLLSLASAAVFGLLPAFRSTAAAGARALADRGAGADGGVRGRRWRGALVVAEVALTVVLLAGAGLMLRSLGRIMDVDPGFEAAGVLTFTVALPAGRYAEIEGVLAAHERLRARIAAMPGVAAVAQASQLPLGAAPGYLTRAYLPEGRPEPPLGAEVIGPWEIVTPGYFAAMGHAIRQGRDFAETDTDASPQIMIVNREFARQMFGAEAEPLGKRVRSWRDENVYREIVGVVDDVRYFGAGDEIRPVVYIPLPQDPRRGLNYVVRAEGDPASLVPALRAAVRDFDPDLATAAFTTMDDAFDASIAGRRFAASLLASFALIALLLAAVGLYGVLSIAVAQRTREFGVRMALGAAARDVRWMVLREAGWLIGAGALAGIIAAIAVTRVLSAVLFGVGATDPATFAAAIGVLLAIGLLASWLPAARATRVDPLRAIRAE